MHQSDLKFTPISLGCLQCEYIYLIIIIKGTKSLFVFFSGAGFFHQTLMGSVIRAPEPGGWAGFSIVGQSAERHRRGSNET